MLSGLIPGGELTEASFSNIIDKNPAREGGNVPWLLIA
jgi:hypothetical protein